MQWAECSQHKTSVMSMMLLLSDDIVLLCSLALLLVISCGDIANNVMLNC